MILVTVCRKSMESRPKDKPNLGHIWRSCFEFQWLEWHQRAILQRRDCIHHKCPQKENKEVPPPKFHQKVEFFIQNQNLDSKFPFEESRKRYFVLFLNHLKRKGEDERLKRRDYSEKTFWRDIHRQFEETFTDILKRHSQTFWRHSQTFWRNIHRHFETFTEETILCYFWTIWKEKRGG